MLALTAIVGSAVCLNGIKPREIQKLRRDGERTRGADGTTQGERSRILANGAPSLCIIMVSSQSLIGAARESDDCSIGVNKVNKPSSENF
jgi:hypothetical protein